MKRILGLLHSAVFALLLVVITIVGAIIVMAVGMIHPYSPINQWVMKTWSRLVLLFAGVNVEVQGLEHVQPNQSYIIVGNHQSHFDIPVVVGYLPLKMTIISKKELFKIPFFGWGMKAAGVLKVDRSNRHQAIATLKEAERILRKHHISLLAFPEGTRSRDGKIHRFKKGPFMVALQTGLPVLPVTLVGTYEILPPKTLNLNPGRVKMVIHPPVDSTQFDLNSRDAFIETVKSTIEKTFWEEYERISQSNRRQPSPIAR